MTATPQVVWVRVLRHKKTSAAAKSSKAARFGRPSAGLWPGSTFVLGKVLEIGEPGACKIFEFALSRLPSPVEVTFKQAATVVRRVDTAVRLAIDRPGGIDRHLQLNFVRHSQASDKDEIGMATPLVGESFSSRGAGSDATRVDRIRHAFVASSPRTMNRR
jgi:hypothetical protein